MTIPKTNIAFLCGLFPKSLQDEIFKSSKVSIEQAANTLQWAILDGLVDLKTSTTVFTLPYVRSYPFGYSSNNFNNNQEVLNNSVPVNTIKFNNLLGYRLVSRFVGTKKTLLNWAKNTEGKKVILIYAIHTPFLRAVIALKKKYPEVKICLVVPDLSNYVSDNKNIVYRFLKKIDSFIIKRSMKSVDAFVLLSDYMVELLKVKNRPWVRVEGIYSKLEDKDFVLKEEYKTILLTGTLNRRYGIMNLVDAFGQIKDQNYRLWICGEGDCRFEIEKIAKNDGRIIYFGQLPREEVLILQKRATVLVNPRTSVGDYTKYSFPSKTMEYLASGTPSILYKLPGIPDEYYQHSFIVQKENAEGLKQMILEVCEKAPSELNDFGKKASQFILENKNPNVQVKKIVEMIDKL